MKKNEFISSIYTSKLKKTIPEITTVSIIEEIFDLEEFKVNDIEARIELFFNEFTLRHSSLFHVSDHPLHLSSHDDGIRICEESCINLISDFHKAIKNRDLLVDFSVSQCSLKYFFNKEGVSFDRKKMKRKAIQILNYNKDHLSAFKDILENYQCGSNDN